MARKYVTKDGKVVDEHDPEAAYVIVDDEPEQKQRTGAEDKRRGGKAEDK